MLKIDGLRVNYGGIEAVKDITFEVPEREIVTLIGANGAGKSTTLRAIAGLVKPASGRIHLQAEDITALSPDRIVSKGITLVPEGRRVFPDLTVLENLKIGAYLRKDSLEDDLAWVYDLFPRLKERSWQAAGTLSGGEQQMLAVGRALMSRPKLMMMDEPSLGLAPLVVKGIFDIIKEINRQGVTTFEVPEREIVTLIGANGAGKSTTLRAIAGLVKPASGRIHLQAEDITALSPDRIVSKGITLVPEGRRVFPDLTVLENLKIGAYLRKDSLEDDLAWVYDLFPRLKERSWQAAGTLSGGEQQMLAVGRALMSRPKLMMMDEPSLGLAPLVVKGIFDIIKEINRQGVTILLIEQNANMALHTADTAYVLETGRLTMKGTGRELLSNEAVKKAYLG